MKRRFLITFAIISLVVTVLCGIGGFALYKSLNDSANKLEPEFNRAKQNGIPLSQQELLSTKTLAPNLNAALDYKKLFDEWSQSRQKIKDERWQSFIQSESQNDDINQVITALSPMLRDYYVATSKTDAFWQIDYSDKAFTSYPLFPAIVDASVLDNKIAQFQNESKLLTAIDRSFTASNHIAKSNDPSSLQASAAIRMVALRSVANLMTRYSKSGDGDSIKQLSLLVSKQEPLNPINVWKATAFLQLDTWENFTHLTSDQQAIFASARRDHDLIINASTTEILSFWNDVVEDAGNQEILTQYLLLAEKVRVLRERTDPTAIPLQKMWTLDSATKGPASLDYIVANEQLNLLKQALEILKIHPQNFPNSFECKEVSVIGQKNYTYKKTDRGFIISCTPSEILSPDSVLAKQTLTYELLLK